MSRGLSFLVYLTGVLVGILSGCARTKMEEKSGLLHFHHSQGLSPLDSSPCAAHRLCFTGAVSWCYQVQRPGLWQ